MQFAEGWGDKIEARGESEISPKGAMWYSQDCICLTTSGAQEHRRVPDGGHDMSADQAKIKLQPAWQDRHADCTRQA